MLFRSHQAWTDLHRIKALLPTELFEGSKDWTQGDVVSRVEWLLAMYENAKTERNELLNQIEASQPEEFAK